MKNAVLSLVLLLGACVQLSAQNYQTFYSNRTAIFTNEYSSYQGMKMDSVKMQGNDSIFYPLKRIGELNNWNCLTPYKSSWLGEKIIISGNWNIFVNNTDSVWIKTDAETNESWTCYSNADYTITAKVIKHELSSFLGIEDFVKTITFQAIDENNSPIEHSWNDKTIQISENYGLIDGFDFTVFSITDYDDYYYSQYKYKLAGLSNPKIGIQNFTWKEVWDFQPGDIIHVIQNDNPGMNGDGPTETKRIITYLEKNEEESKTVFKLAIQESQRKRMWTTWEEESITYSEYETTESISEYETFDKLPGEVIIEGNDHASTNIMFFYNGHLCKAGGGNSITKYGDEQCWHQLILLDYPSTSGYIKELGGPYYSYEGDGLAYYEKKLVYYKKGNTEWGTPLKITSINEVSADAAIPVGYYNILGKRLPTEPTQGIYIILYDNGKAEKVVKQNTP